MEQSSEVRLRRVISGLFAGIAGLGLVMSPGVGTAQTTVQTPAAAPVPTAEGRDKIQSAPGYGQQPVNVQSVPTPQRAASPVVTTAPPTTHAPYTALPAYGDLDHSDPDGSTYIPVDSWVYPAMLRLYSLGYVDSMYLSMRPYTRRSALHMLQASESAILTGNDRQAQGILAALLTELADEEITDKTERGTVYGLQSVYTRTMGISGPILTDSYHLGQTFFNDYGRPHETGFNNNTGFSTLNEQGPWSLYLRGEYQHAPPATGYSLALSQQVSLLDEIAFAPPNDPQATIPAGRLRPRTRSGWWRRRYRSMFWSMRSRWANRTRGWGQGWAARWTGRTTRRTFTPSASTGWNRSTLSTCRGGLGRCANEWLC